MWPNMIKIFEYGEGLAKSKRPQSKSYKNVLVHISDKLAVVKFKFFVYVASILEPNLTVYQGDGPMVPFMYDDIKFYKGALTIIVKPKVLEKCKTGLDLMKLEFDDDTLVEAKRIDLGFAAEEEIRKLDSNVDEKAVLKVRENARDFVVEGCQKLEMRNPLQYVIVRNAVCFNQLAILRLQINVLEEKFKKMMKKLVSLKVSKFTTADLAMTQNKDFLAKDMVQHKDKPLSYNRKIQRIESFFFKKLK